MLSQLNHSLYSYEWYLNLFRKKNIVFIFFSMHTTHIFFDFFMKCYQTTAFNPISVIFWKFLDFSILKKEKSEKEFLIVTDCIRTMWVSTVERQPIWLSFRCFAKMQEILENIEKKKCIIEKKRCIIGISYFFVWKSEKFPKIFFVTKKKNFFSTKICFIIFTFMYVQNKCVLGSYMYFSKQIRVFMLYFFQNSTFSWLLKKRVFSRENIYRKENIKKKNFFFSIVCLEKRYGRKLQVCKETKRKQWVLAIW